MAQAGEGVPLTPCHANQRPALPVFGASCERGIELSTREAQPQGFKANYWTQSVYDKLQFH